MVDPQNINSHFMLSINSEIQKICKPLFDKLDLAYFNYSRIYRDGSLFGLMSSPEYAKCFLENSKRARILSPKPEAGIQAQTIISLWGQRADPWIMKTLSDLGIYHPIMFSDVGSDYTENFVFGSKIDRASSIEGYFNNLITLQRFQEYFRSIANKLIEQSQEAEKRVFLGEASHPFSLEDFIEPFDPNQHTTVELRVGKQLIMLTPKQKQCLEHLSKGLSAKEIAMKMGVSPRTVETHLEHIKTKFNVNYKSELLKMWEQAFYL